MKKKIGLGEMKETQKNSLMLLLFSPPTNNKHVHVQAKEENADPKREKQELSGGHQI